MSFKKILRSIKEANLPCYLANDEDELDTHICFDDKICCQAKQLSIFEMCPDSPKGTILEASPILKQICGSSYLKTPAITTLGNLDQKNFGLLRKKLVKKYFQTEQMIESPKLRPHSLERVTPKEFSVFTQYRQMLKSCKKKVSFDDSMGNLWISSVILICGFYWRLLRRSTSYKRAIHW